MKCSSSADGVGLSSKSKLPPVIEEEEFLQHSGKVDTFGGLSDLMVTSQELFKDDITTPKLASPAIEATFALRSIPAAQELTPAAKADITPKPKSGL